MLFLDFINIPPAEKNVFVINTVDDFYEIDQEDINEISTILDIRNCSKSVFNIVQSILDKKPAIDIFATDPVTRTMLSRTNGIVVATPVLTDKTGILELVIDFDKGGILCNKAKKLFMKG